MGRRVSIVLITWNSARYLPRCAGGIAALRGIELELVVVDNASDDDSSGIAKRLLPSARIVTNSENLGYSAAANQGIAASGGDLVLLLNPDVFLHPEYVSRLVAALDSAGVEFASATGKLLRGMGEGIEPTPIVDSKGIRMTRSGRHLDIDAGALDRDQEMDQERDRQSDGEGEGEPLEVFGVSGAAALHRRRFLDDVAVEGRPLDESFFAYREDADLAWRGRLYGWRALYVPSALAWHVRRVTPEARAALPATINMHSVKNRFLLRAKNQGSYLALRDAVFTLPRDLMVIAATLTIERTSIPALRWLIVNRKAILAARRAIQNRRRVSDRLLAPWFGGTIFRRIGAGETR